MTNEDKELKVAEFMASLRPSPNNCSDSFYHYFYYGDTVEIGSPALKDDLYREAFGTAKRDAESWTLGRWHTASGATTRPQNARIDETNASCNFVWEFWDSTLQGVIEQYLTSIGEL